ncbi:MAG: hypothetical protein ABIA63_04215, partial [bacterium]
KQLKPEPELSFVEQGYIQLKDGKKDFKLKKEKKYFIFFPAPGEKNFYIVLNISNKDKIESFFTSRLIKRKTFGQIIKDESPDLEKMSVYSAGNEVPEYYWLIDRVTEDVELNIDYRYVPQWRFKFENKHAEFAKTLEENLVDRGTYEEIGASFHFDSFDFTRAIDTVSAHSSLLDKVHKALLAIETIFPDTILNSKDTAYQHYVNLKKKLEDELNFQSRYLDVMRFFHNEFMTRGNPAGFLDHVVNFINYFSGKDRHTQNVVLESQTVMQGRLAEMVPFYDQSLSGKADARPFEPEIYRLPDFKNMGKLYEASGISAPPEYAALLKFINEFDSRSTALGNSGRSISQCIKSVDMLDSMPDNAFFGNIMSQLSEVQRMIPLQMNEEFGKYQNYACTKELNKKAAGLNMKVLKLLAQYLEAENTVKQVNELKEQKDYSGMLGLLKQKTHLAFLIDKYRGVDKMSVDEQAKNIRSGLENYYWYGAESGLRKLHLDKNYLDYDQIRPVKDQIVKELEDSLYIKVDNLSRYRVQKFCEEKAETLENIDSLYNDSVFLPAHDITFSSGTRSQLLQRKADLVEHLAKLKDNEFPAKSISLLYDQFMKNPYENGVLRARAVVAHGKYYKGDNQKIKMRIFECNPWLPKWITQPVKYRRVFALPITDNEKGSNIYLLRLNIRIPSEAKFPVYDVNIKIPKQIAGNAGKKQWYQKITLNKKPLKSEGRFTITTPGPSNDYECQITPVQMKKDNSNFLDIYFKHNSFNVYPISTMVQKPIIKKN